MYVRIDSLVEEVRVTVDAAVELANLLTGEEPVETADVRKVLVDHEFTRAPRASDAEIDEVADELQPLAELIESLPDSALEAAVQRVNTELAEREVRPSLSDHDGFALHIHWTRATATFAAQVAVDLLMALAQTLCDHGIERFGRCAAEDCDRVFYDTSKNSSRRFCSDPRCASTTHTAAHRARLRGA